MKKTFLIIVLAFLMAMPSFAQDKQATFYTGNYYKEIAFTSADTVSNNDSLFSIVVNSNKAEPLKYSIEIKMDSTSGTPTTSVYLQAKIFSNDSYTDLDTVDWAGTSSDTTFTFTQVTTAKYYRYWRVYHDASAAAQKYAITRTNFKFWSK